MNFVELKVLITVVLAFFVIIGARLEEGREWRNNERETVSVVSGINYNIYEESLD